MPTIVTDPVPGSGLPDPLSLIPQPLSDNVQKFFFSATGSGTVAAPPCKQQGKFTAERRDDAVPPRRRGHRRDGADQVSAGYAH